MNTPIADFIRSYNHGNPCRLHMPGHKGLFENTENDITEITGADSLFEASGILRESEKNASQIFGCPTFYSTEGSSLCLRAMLRLASLYAKRQGRRPLLAVGRNAHRTVWTAAALLDLETLPIDSGEQTHLACRITPTVLSAFLEKNPDVTALLITTPDYLGNCTDVAALSEVCRARGVLLLVDGAHGAYLKFLNPSRHPTDLGADLCCTSAHKTLPVLTGGAYLHLHPDLDPFFEENVKEAMALFASTSPSYLILCSLDEANPHLLTLPDTLKKALAHFEEAKRMLCARGFAFLGDEPLKWTVCPKPVGYTGDGLRKILEASGIFCEYSDADHLVLMLSPYDPRSVTALQNALSALPFRPPIASAPPVRIAHTRACCAREAILSPSAELPIGQCVGRTVASPTVGCPPAVPLLLCGETVSPEDLPLLRYYGVTHLRCVYGPMKHEN